MSLVWLNAASHCRAVALKSWSYFSSGAGVMNCLSWLPSVLSGPSQKRSSYRLGNQVASSPGSGWVSSIPLGPAMMMSTPGATYEPGVERSWSSPRTFVVSTRPLPPAQGSWIASALVGQ